MRKLREQATVHKESRGPMNVTPKYVYATSPLVRWILVVITSSRVKNHHFSFMSMSFFIIVITLP
mgnify:FL=1